MAERVGFEPTETPIEISKLLKIQHHRVPWSPHAGFGNTPIERATELLGRKLEQATVGPCQCPTCQFTLAGLYFSTNSTAALSITFLVSSRESQ